MRMFVYMWGNAPFPTDVMRDAIVGSFRMMMQLDADDYHHRSALVEDLQRCAEWDGRTPVPEIRLEVNQRWTPPISRDHPYAQLFPNAYQQIELDLNALVLDRNRAAFDAKAAGSIRDLANTVLRKIPGMSGRLGQSLGHARPHVLIIDDEAANIVEILQRHRIGYESDSACLSDIFHLVGEELNLKGEPPDPQALDEWIRKRVAGEIAP